MDYTVLPESAEESQIALLAFASIVGGGLLAYEAGRSIRAGDIFKTDPTPEKAEVGIVAGVAGTVMLGLMYQEAAKEVGWKTLVGGAAAVFGFTFLVKTLRR